MKSSTTYQRLGQRSLRFSGNRGWLGEDHLLLTTTRFFEERYTRLYWGDIQAVLLYELERPSGVLLAFEWICLLAPLIAAGFLWYAWHAPRAWVVFIPAVVLTGWYALWRMTRLNWACYIPTKTSGARLPVATTLGNAHQAAETIKARVAAVQGALDLSTEVTALHISPGLAQGGRNTASKRPVVVLHGIVFGAGLILAPLQLVPNPTIAAFTSLFSFTYYFGLIGAYFVQQDFEFPFAARSAAVISQALTVVAGIAGLLAISMPGLRDVARLSDHNATMAFVAVQALFSLYGIVGLYSQSVKRPDAQQVKITTLGLS
jgi:hypothetical protein